MYHRYVRLFARQRADLLHRFVNGEQSIELAHIVDPEIVRQPLHAAYYESAKHGLNQLMQYAVAKDDSTYRSAIAEALLSQVHDRAASYADKHGGELIKGINKTTRTQTREVIGKALEERWGVDKLAAELQKRGTFDAARAEMIARTEISLAQNTGMIAAGKAYQRKEGVALHKMWLLGPNPCPLCLAHESEIVRVGAQFEDGESPPLHPNCMCEVELIELEDEDGEDFDETED